MLPRFSPKSPFLPVCLLALVALTPASASAATLTDPVGDNCREYTIPSGSHCGPDITSAEFTIPGDGFLHVDVSYASLPVDFIQQKPEYIELGIFAPASTSPDLEVGDFRFHHLEPKMGEQVWRLEEITPTFKPVGDGSAVVGSLGIELLVPLAPLGDLEDHRYALNAGSTGEVIPEHPELAPDTDLFDLAKSLPSPPLLPPPPPVEEENRPPVANPDHWTVQAGRTADEHVLENDTDPDGDPITAEVIEISFARKEWSGMDPDGGFLYTAGPGTSRVLNKKITYVAIDDKGARSQPTTAIVEVRPTQRSVKQPLTGKAGGAGASATGPYWDGPWAWGQLCLGSGLKASCYTMLSIARTQDFVQDPGWALDPTGPSRWCVKYGLLPMKNKDCAKKLIEKGLSFVWDRSVAANAAQFGDCLLVRVSRRRSLRHPLAGVWGKPEYHPLDSLVSPFNGNALVSGYGTWPKGLTGRWRVPLVCERNGMVYRHVYQPLVEAP